MDIRTSLELSTVSGSSIILGKWLAAEINTYERLRARYGWESSVDQIIETALDEYCGGMDSEDLESKYALAVADAAFIEGENAMEKYYVTSLKQAYILYWRICFGKTHKSIIRWCAKRPGDTIQDDIFNMLQKRGLVPNVEVTKL